MMAFHLPVCYRIFNPDMRLSFHEEIAYMSGRSGIGRIIYVTGVSFEDLSQLGDHAFGPSFVIHC